jgi:hypothetical protein
MGKPLKTILKPERFLATIAYDGTDFHGWQVNPGQRTVESAIEERLSRIFKTPIPRIYSRHTARFLGATTIGFLDRFLLELAAFLIGASSVDRDLARQRRAQPIRQRKPAALPPVDLFSGAR